MAQHDLAKIIPISLARLDPSGVIEKIYPKAVTAISDVGGRASSSFMLKHFTLGDKHTPIGKAVQCLAEIDAIKNALEANREKLSPEDKHFKGAVKSLVLFLSEYDRLCEKIGVDTITDELKEANEPREQIYRMFFQAYTEAIANSGIADSGNLAYSAQLSIDPTECQYEVNLHLINEKGEMRNNRPSQTLEWLERMFLKYGDRSGY